MRMFIVGAAALMLGTAAQAASGQDISVSIGGLSATLGPGTASTSGPNIATSGSVGPGPAQALSSADSTGSNASSASTQALAAGVPNSAAAAAGAIGGDATAKTSAGR